MTSGASPGVLGATIRTGRLGYASAATASMGNSAVANAISAVDVGRDIDRKHVVAQHRVAWIRTFPRRHRTGEQIDDDRQTGALVRADRQQRSTVVEILRSRRRPAMLVDDPSGRHIFAL